jgi:Flp pilus assembly protein TadB
MAGKETQAQKKEQPAGSSTPGLLAWVRQRFARPDNSAKAFALMFEMTQTQPAKEPAKAADNKGQEVQQPKTGAGSPGHTPSASQPPKPVALAKAHEQDRELANARPFRRVGVVIPTPVVDYFGRKLKHAGIREDTRIWLGKRLLFSFCIGFMLVTGYILIFDPMASITTESVAIGIFIVGFLAAVIPLYLKLYFIITDRTATLERLLPDFLLLTGSNLRAGMSPFSAFLHAARPEFGALYTEVSLAMAKAGGTSSLVDALEEISEYFDSGMLRRITLLFGKGLRSGGQLAKLLHSSAEEIRRIQDLREELATATKSYTIFLGFIVVIVMPFLLSVSTHFLTVFLSLQPPERGDELSQLGSIPSFSGKISMTPDQMLISSVITLLLTSLLISGLVGIIGKGKALYGIRYFPIFAAASIGFYFIAKVIVGSVLSGFGAV